MSKNGKGVYIDLSADNVRHMKALGNVVDLKWEFIKKMCIIADEQKLDRNTLIKEASLSLQKSVETENFNKLII